MLCLVAKARGACNEAASSAAALEALAIYEELGLTSLQLEALEGLSAACKVGQLLATEARELEGDRAMITITSSRQKLQASHQAATVSRTF